MELFRSIVLCQPDAPSSMLQLSDFLRRLSHITDGSVNHLLNRLCISHHPVETGQQQQQQQGEQQPTTSRRQYRLKTISFSLGTCTLQMYAALLENSVRPHDRYEAWQMKPLLTNTENTIHFLRNVLLHPVGWVKSFYDREDPNECELCHIRMVSAFVTLLFRVLLCWNQQSVKDEEGLLTLLFGFCARIASSNLALLCRCSAHSLYRPARCTAAVRSVPDGVPQEAVTNRWAHRSVPSTGNVQLAAAVPEGVQFR